MIGAMIPNEVVYGGALHATMLSRRAHWSHHGTSVASRRGTKLSGHREPCTHHNVHENRINVIIMVVNMTIMIIIVLIGG